MGGHVFADSRKWSMPLSIANVRTRFLLIVVVAVACGKTRQMNVLLSTA